MKHNKPQHAAAHAAPHRAEPQKTKPKTLPAWARRCLLALAAAVLGLNLYQWNARSLVGNALPMPFGVGAAVVMSGSMEPTLRVNDLVLVRAAETYALGEIVVYQTGRSLVVHRVVELAPDGSTLLTQGDANNGPDAPIPAAAVKGRVTLRLPWVGLAVRLLKSPGGTLAVLAAAVLLAEGSFRRQKAGDDAALEALRAEIEALRQEAEK